MEANTVILSLVEYNALRDFKTNLEKGNTLVTSDSTVIGSNYYYAQRYVSTDEAVKEITKQNESLLKRLDDLSAENYALKNPSLKEITIQEVKKLSIWQFRRWKGGNHPPTKLILR